MMGMHSPAVTSRLTPVYISKKQLILISRFGFVASSLTHLGGKRDFSILAFAVRSMKF